MITGTTGRSDAELLAAHVDGDADAFGELFGRHRDRLWAVALRTMRDPDDAADALQDAMISAFRRAGSYRGEAAVTTWLHRIVVNACLDRLRSTRARPTTALPEDLEEYAGRGALSMSQGHPTPEEHVEASERKSAVLQALAQLPDDQRLALVLVDMQGYPVQEAAEMLDCAVGTVKSRCSRGRSRLAKALRLSGVIESATDLGNPTGPSSVQLAERGEPHD